MRFILLHICTDAIFQCGFISCFRSSFEIVRERMYIHVLSMKTSLSLFFLPSAVNSKLLYFTPLHFFLLSFSLEVSYFCTVLVRSFIYICTNSKPLLSVSP